MVEVPYDKTDSVKDTLIYYSYSVSWIQEKDIKWANRWDRYISSQEPEIHWYSIINSMIIILFLSGMVAIIILRSLNSDIAMYNSEDAKEDPEDTVGWKLLHGDVFRPPRFSGVLCAFVGSGIQFSLMFGSVVFLSVVGFLNPAFRGGLVSSAIFIFVFMGFVDLI